MPRQYNNSSERTSQILNRLINEGVSHISVLIRHAERHYTENDAMEPFMRLTHQGRSTTFDFGQSLPGSLPVQLYSSFIGRCIETAYLIDKGFTVKHDRLLPHTMDEQLLSPSYINDIDQVVKQVVQIGNHGFLRQWFDHRLDESIIDNPVLAADRICGFMDGCLNSKADRTLTLAVSHDWNLFVVKEIKLNLPFEKAGDIGYLEGVFFFKKEDSTYIMDIGPDASPVLLK